MTRQRSRHSAYLLAAITLLTAISLVIGVLAQAETVDALASEPIRGNLPGNRWGELFAPLPGAVSRGQYRADDPGRVPFHRRGLFQRLWVQRLWPVWL